MKSFLPWLLLLACVSGAAAQQTLFFAPGGAFTQTNTITLTQAGEVLIETGGTIASTSQVDSGATIWVDGAQVSYSDHSVRDASQTAVLAFWDTTLAAGTHTIETSVTAPAGGASNTFIYICEENELGAVDQEVVSEITNEYQAADSQLQSDLTTLIQNTENQLQSQINTTNGNVTQLQQQLTALTQQLSTLQGNQSTDEGTITQLQQQIAADESAIATLQAQGAAQQTQLQALTEAEDSHYSTLESQLNSLSGQVTNLSNTSVRKSSLNTYLLYGAAGAGATGLGLGAYSLFFNQTSLGTSPVSSPADSGLLDVSPDGGVPDAYGEEHVFSPDSTPTSQSQNEKHP
jgi:hypothetical protein